MQLTDRKRHAKEPLDAQIKDQLHAHVAGLGRDVGIRRQRVVGDSGLEIVKVAALLVGGHLLGVLVLLVTLADLVAQVLHVAVGQGAQAEDADGIGALRDIVDLDVLDDGRHAGLHDVLEGVGHAGEHVRVDEAPDQGHGRVEPLDGLGDQVDDGGLAALLLAGPLDIAASADEVLGPEEDGRGDAGGQRHEPEEVASEQAAEEDDGQEEAGAEQVGTGLDGGEHGLIADGRGGMEEHVGLLAVDGDIAGGAGLDRIGRRRDVLVVAVLLAGLRVFGLDGSVLAEIGVGHGELGGFCHVEHGRVHVIDFDIWVISGEGKTGEEERMRG